ncbi:MAG: aminotransferase class I/II-fold pyridoxal phosphate-dependent enzyme [Candidatus Latescibacteria bacterium]|nr:aminotransferase class I/II-fold pyridoxal phosphate-dependent enzyme [Candidatus Latescibacterota bacterium]NIM20882.1 aminotransferase class I/II-fold pyridoxal phosphate-dependent enzyme [Candidatus Latescibacterota bacterium]NIM65017.1 aminotransferase class I/II-fold pyridoxal phosphate-dependent enzyme [Candidatus Latescibacterota bacterium]NIO01532.1 aminotransferase class I/II-fold pyridoxal phosphate-dependent enzyme [Candidatus Latescibacterota bacterium]NIO28049.1 aminotransferase
MGHIRTVPFLDLKAQTERLREEIVEAIDETIDSSSYILGPHLERFEKSFCDYCGCSHAVGTSSGTAALHVALVAFGVGTGDEVITAPNTFIATVEAILYTGATPVLVDVDENTFCIDPERVERAISPRTKAIIPVHLYGQPCDMDRISSIAQQHGLFVLEDACQAHGAYFNGKRTGSIGNAAAFSFYPSKNLGAFGDAGAVTTSDPEIAEKVKALRHHAQFQANTFSTIGFNYRLDSIQAAILGVKLRHLDEWNQMRRNIAEYYKSKLEGSDYRFQATTPGSIPSCHILAVQHPRRDLVHDALDEMKIGWGKHITPPIHLQPGYRFLGYEKGSLPVSERLAEELVSLPIYPELTVAQVDYVIDALSKVNVSI